MDHVRAHVCCSRCGTHIENVSRFAMRNHARNCVFQGHSSTSTGNDDVDMADAEEMVHPSDAEVLPTNPFIADEEGTAAAIDAGWDDLGNFEHLTQFMGTGRCICNDAQTQLIKFVHMAHGGYGVSRAFSIGMLEYCKESGGKNVHLPDSWVRCVAETTTLIEQLQGKRKTFALDVPIPDNVRELLADPAQTHIDFQFECPITEMIRVAMFSKTCQTWDNVAFTYEDNDGFLDDFCNGDRYKRIAADISPGGAILGAVLATDGICLDKCMFDSQEVRP